MRNSRRMFAAWACLLAALCMYAPLGLAAWPANSSCCVDGMCALPQHPHSAASHSAERVAHCEQGAAGMANCGMACCHDQRVASTSPVAYLLPARVSVSAAAAEVRMIAAAPGTATFHFVEPLFPPPRT